MTLIYIATCLLFGQVQSFLPGHCTDKTHLKTCWTQEKWSEWAIYDFP